MQRFLLAVVFALAACGPTAPTERPGSQQVYQQIAAESDCATLQAMFDQAGDNHDRAVPGSDEARWTLGYMEAADAQMRAVGCY